MAARVALAGLLPELLCIARLLPACGELAARGFAASAPREKKRAAAGSQGAWKQLEEISAVDTNYRDPTETLWPASRHQERFASRVHTALSTVLLRNASLRDALVSRLGFGVKDVRMSPDNLKAFILWDSLTGQPDVLARELARLGPTLRSEVARALRARNVPQLVFRHDSLTARQQEVEDIFRQLDEEEQAEAAEEEAADEEAAEEEAAEPAAAGAAPRGGAS